MKLIILYEIFSFNREKHKYTENDLSKYLNLLLEYKGYKPEETKFDMYVNTYYKVNRNIYLEGFDSGNSYISEMFTTLPDNLILKKYRKTKLFFESLKNFINRNRNRYTNNGFV